MTNPVGRYVSEQKPPIFTGQHLLFTLSWHGQQFRDPQCGLTKDVPSSNIGNHSACRARHDESLAVLTAASFIFPFDVRARARERGFYSENLFLLRCHPYRVYSALCFTCLPLTDPTLFDKNPTGSPFHSYIRWSCIKSFTKLSILGCAKVTWCEPLEHNNTVLI